MNLRELGCEEMKWMELAESHVQWWAFVIPSSTTTVFVP
jgi:hypothetical protein